LFAEHVLVVDSDGYTVNAPDTYYVDGAPEEDTVHNTSSSEFVRAVQTTIKTRWDNQNEINKLPDNGYSIYGESVSEHGLDDRLMAGTSATLPEECHYTEKLVVNSTSGL
jgi:hypothetical protein